MNKYSILQINLEINSNENPINRIDNNSNHIFRLSN